jgi:peptide deformylase
VGLAGPQVGVTVRIFVASPTFEESDRRVYVNPHIVALDGTQVGDEGCLSFPGVSCKIKRANAATIRALGLDGEEFEETGEELTARIFQHECDHLDGRLLVDRMGSVAKLANRRTLKELEDKFAAAAV